MSSAVSDVAAAHAPLVTSGRTTVSIVIVHLDSRPELMACLGSLRQVVGGCPVDVVVVENGSRRPLDLATLRAVEPRVSGIVKSPVNLGFAGGANLGIQHALAGGATHVMLLNDDAIVTPDFLVELLEVARREPAAGALGPVVVLAADHEQVWFAGASFDPRRCVMETPGIGEPPPPRGQVRASDFVTGCCVLLTREALGRVGMLDERFFLYWEDADWGFRARATGLSNLVVTAARIAHRVSVSSGGLQSPLRVYHGVRSRLQFGAMYAARFQAALERRLLRDVAWLLIRSSSPRRWALARAHVAALRDWRLERRGPGPEWLWRGM
jgi:GT2 family glycosyltransferase